MIDLAALAQARLYDSPYPHAVIPRTFRSGSVARRLRAEFPADGFRRSERTEGARGKRYLMFNRFLVADGLVLPGAAGLPEVWREVVDEIRTADYRAALAALSGVDLRGCTVEARVDRYGAGCWVEPHVDKTDKALSQLFFFNDPWQSGWGGDFRVLNGPAMDACARQALPGLGSSVVMVRSDRSWHGVPPVTPECPQTRLSLLVHFVRQDRG